MLNYDFFALTETWLNGSIFDTELGFNNYNIFRTDRSAFTSSSLRGGGVAICVKNSYLASQICVPFNNVEQLFVEVKLNRNLKIILVACYIPPNSPSSLYLNHTQSIDFVLSKFNYNVKMLVMGDFNLPNVHMFSNSNGLQFHGIHSESSDVIFDCLTLNEFSQCNSHFNTSGSLLDLIFSNFPNTSVSLCNNEILVPADNYHPPLCINLEYINNYINSVFPNYKTLDFRRANYSEIIRELGSIDWNILFECHDIDEACDVFYKKVFDLISVYVLLKK